MSEPSSNSNLNASFKASTPSLPAPVTTTQLQAPPSPRTHRALRRLQSAHTLGARAREQATPSLISQQRQRDDQRTTNVNSKTNSNGVNSPTRSSPAPPPLSNQNVHRSPQRGRANSDATPPLVHQMNVVTASKRAGSKKPVFSHGHLPLHQIIREGPTDGDFLGALESARWKVIDEGVKSAEDGMVSPTNSCFRPQTNHGVVNTKNIRLARPPRCPYPINRRLSCPHPPRRFSSLLQNPQRHISHPHNRSPLPPPC